MVGLWDWGLLPWTEEALRTTSSWGDANDKDEEECWTGIMPREEEEPPPCIPGDITNGSTWWYDAGTEDVEGER